jgi:hypothetical protein
MRKIIVLAMLAGVATLGLSIPASADTVPDVHGLQPFAAESDFMSLPGFFRWQYFVENHEWITRAEADSQVKSQSN